jgi:hypothetical protein
MRNSAGADPPALGIQNQKQASDDKYLFLENPRPVGTESPLTENAASPVQAESRQEDPVGTESERFNHQLPIRRFH